MPERVRGSLDRPICLVPQLTGVGGVASFQSKMMEGLTERGIAITHSLAEQESRAVLVVGGTRDLLGLWRARRKGTPVIQRLDGINWIHRKRRTGLRHYLKAERANLLLSWIRRYIATGVVYQSHFVHTWWERAYGPTAIEHTVVHNGVDLERYTPEGKRDLPEGKVRVLVVEGRLAGGYELGLEHAIGFAEALDEIQDQPVELLIVGDVSEGIRRKVRLNRRVEIHWEGGVSRDRIPYLDRSAHVLFAADVHPACPNSVIEALACGLPVVGFDTGALSEIVDDAAGRIVPFGSDAWDLGRPDFVGLAHAANEVLQQLEAFRKGARNRAVDKFGLDRMIDGYLRLLDR